MNVSHRNNVLATSLSRERLLKYLQSVNDDLDAAITLYEKNIDIAEAFYTSLHCVEVCLRNHLNLAMTNAYGTDWLQCDAVPLTNESRKFISQALDKLAEDPLPIRQGRIVAELRFAFWVGLLGADYDATLWRQCLHKAFWRARPKRRTVHARFNAIRRFRNRVAHYEPILWRPTPLTQTHTEILEAIGWMCRETATWTAQRSCVPHVLT